MPIAMRKRIFIVIEVIASLLMCRTAAAQEVVVDPTHIGVAVENTASSLEEMITMIEEMFTLNGKLDDLYGLAEKVSEVADRFREVGYLVDMTDSYNDLLRRTREYSTKVKNWGAEGDLYGYERQLRYFYRSEMQGMKLFNQYIEYFRNLKTSDADKAEQAQKALKELEERRVAVTREMDAAEQSRQVAGCMVDAVKFLDKSMDSGDYAESYRHLGNADYAATSWIMVVRVIMGIILLFLAVSAFIIIFRGQEMGTLTGAMALFRWFIAAVTAWMFLELYNSLII